MRARARSVGARAFDVVGLACAACRWAALAATREDSLRSTKRRRRWVNMARLPPLCRAHAFSPSRSFASSLSRSLSRARAHSLSLTLSLTLLLALSLPTFHTSI
eukprot:2119293-Pleurochrysis_carterae.AAC.2